MIDAHGIAGELVVRLGVPSSTTLQRAPRIFLARTANDPRECTVLGVRPGPRGALVRIRGIASREDALSWRGAVVSVAREHAPPLGEGEYYHADLIGLTVVDPGDRHLGTVVEILETGGTDVLIVRDGGRETLVPLAEEFVQAIDVAGGRIVATPPEMGEDSP